MKRIVSLLLVFMVVLSLIPSGVMTVYAAERYSVENTKNVSGQEIVAQARKWANAGAIYWSGIDPWQASIYWRTGYTYNGQLSFDCSGFVGRVLNDCGFKSSNYTPSYGSCILSQTYGSGYIGISIEDLVNYGTDITAAVTKAKKGDYSDLQAGDLIGWTSGSLGRHIIIYAGMNNGKPWMVEFTGSGYLDRAITTSYQSAFQFGARLVSNSEENSLIKESYPSYCTIEVTDATTNVKSLPCSVETNANSKTIETAKKGATYTAIGLYRNTPGNLWYKVQAKSGGTGYMYAGDTKFVARKSDDMEVTGVAAPTELEKDGRFWIEGVIRSKYNQLTEVGAIVCKTYMGDQMTGTILPVSVNEYSLYKSDVDDCVEFNKLPVGEYDYMILASAKSYYATSGTELTTTEINKILHYSTFCVKESTSCSHTYVSSVTAPTYTQQGYTTHTCSKCGYSYKDSYTDILTAKYRITFNANGGEMPEAFLQNTLNGINIGRGQDYLVVYNNGGTLVNTNEYGREVMVDATGKVIGGRYTHETNQLTVPVGGFVLSGHGVNADWSWNIENGYYVAYDPDSLNVWVYKNRNDYLLHHKTVIPGETIGQLPTVSRQGYIFNGWSSTSDGNTPVTENSSISSDMTLYARWKRDCSVLGHSCTSKVTAPNCTAQGYTTYTCTVCGYSYKDNYTNPTGHSYTYNTTKDPTTSATGTLTGTCSRCSGTTTVTLPKLNSTDYTYSVKTAAGCTTAGVGTYTWKTTTYGTYKFDVSISATGHSYTYAATKAPTTSATGTLTGTCSKCSGTTTVTLPKLNTTDYNYSVKTAAGCTSAGVGTYTWKTTTYGTFKFDVSIPAKGHTYTSKVTAPTCTAQGYTTYTCTCGNTYKDSYTNALGHSYSYKATTNPSATATGVLTGTCSKCSGTTTVTLPKLNTTDYNYSVKTAAGCTSAGVGTYTWKTTTYGTFKFDVSISATGHSYTGKVTAPTCTEQGYTTYTCTCGHSYKDSYTNATGHSYSYKITKTPTTSATGTLTGTCSKCSATTTVTLPKLNATDYTYSVTKEPSYTAAGVGTYTWKTSTYGTFKFDVSIDKLVATLSEIQIATNPTKTSYSIGENLDTTGLTLNLIYSDGSTKIATTGFTVSGFDSATAGTKTLTVTYSGKSTTFNITVESSSLTGSCGEDLTWELDEQGTLTISGTGAMNNWTSVTLVPWNEYKSDIKAVVLENGVTSIGNYAFAVCSNMTSVSIPDGVISIGKNCFIGCTSLTAVKIPDSVVTVDEYAFCNCKGLSAVTIGEGVTTIGSYAFYSLDSLVSVIIPDSVTAIDDHAFASCDNLQMLTIGRGVTKFDTAAFTNCVSIKQISYNAVYVEGMTEGVFCKCGVNGTGITLTIGAEVVRLPAALFASGQRGQICNITTVIFDSGSVCSSIGIGAFKDCTGITDVYYPGPKAQWNQIAIDSNNAPLTDATLHTVEVELTGITVATMPGKIQYTMGENLDTTGLVLKLTYSDGSAKTVTTGYTVSGFDSATAGTKTVTVTYEGKTATFTVTVTEPQIDENAPMIVISNEKNLAGNSVTVTVTLKNNPGILNAVLTLNYGDGLELTQIEKGEALSSMTMTAPGKLQNNCNFLWDTIDDADTSNGVLLKLTFKIAEDAQVGAKYDVKLSYVMGDIADNDFQPVNMQIVNGSVEVIDFRFGDVNNDGRINGTDVTMVRRYIAGGYDVQILTQAADVNGDGRINGTDVTLIRRYIAGGYGVELNP